MHIKYLLDTQTWIDGLKKGVCGLRWGFLDVDRRQPRSHRLASWNCLLCHYIQASFPPKKKTTKNKKSETDTATNGGWQGPPDFHRILANICYQWATPPFYSPFKRNLVSFFFYFFKIFVLFLYVALVSCLRPCFWFSGLILFYIKSQEKEK